MKKPTKQEIEKATMFLYETVRVRVMKDGNLIRPWSEASAPVRRQWGYIAAHVLTNGYRVPK